MQSGAILDSRLLPDADNYNPVENTSELTKPVLDRKDVLNAIDFEISHRESMLSRHGFSTWGIIASTCALLWAGTTESLNGTHNWTHVLLVLLVGAWGLGILASPWTKALGLWSLRSSNDQSIKALILRFGLDNETIVYSALHTILKLGIAVYLGFQGFVLLSVITSALNVFALMLMGLSWIVFSIKLPLRFPVPPRVTKNQSVTILAWLLVLVMTLVHLDAIWLAWPIQSADTRLGLVFAALSTLWGMSLVILKPPTTTTNLRELRSELAFGEIEAGEARTKALHFLRGTPDEYFVTSKADEVEAELKQTSQLYKSLTDRLQQLIPLAEKLKAANCSEAMLHVVAREFRTHFKAIRGKMSAADVRMTRARALLIQVSSRIETAELLLNLSPEIGKTVLQRLNVLLLEVETSKRGVTKIFLAEDIKSAIDFICAASQDIKLPRNQTPYQHILTCFRD